MLKIEATLLSTVFIPASLKIYIKSSFYKGNF